MIAASIVALLGLGIIIAITVWKHLKAAHPRQVHQAGCRPAGRE
jgi:hypothetical protein